jgi:cofilin
MAMAYKMVKPSAPPADHACRRRRRTQPLLCSREINHACKQPWLMTLCACVCARGFDLQATEGMDVKEECQRWFMEMKWKKVHRFVVYRIDERSRAVLVDRVGGPGEGYEELVAALPGDDCRYAVFDFDFVTVDNCQKSKIFFIAWYVRTYEFLSCSRLQFPVHRLRLRPCPVVCLKEKKPVLSILTSAGRHASHSSQLTTRKLQIQWLFNQ